MSEILALCGARDDCRLWSNTTGMARALTHNGIVRFGLIGSADILGIFRGGIFLAIEVKTGRAKRTSEQVAFADMVIKFGGHYFVVASAKDAKDCLDQLATPCE